MSKTLSECADELTVVRRALVDAVLKASGAYRLLDWLVRRLAARR